MEDLFRQLFKSIKIGGVEINILLGPRFILPGMLS
jgi:hypothetical protein